MKVYQQKGFTILELIIVTGIILVLIVTFRNIFQNNNKDFLYAETCMNKIYGDMNNFLYAAMTSKGIYIPNETIFPTQYNISIEPEEEIKLRYQRDDGNTGIYIKNILSDIKLNQYYCKTNNYSTKLSGENFTITINKNGLQDQNTPTFSINNEAEIFTKTAEMYLCYTGNQCKEIANFIVDIRTQSIKKKKCIQINKEALNCLQRDQ